jgi:hypothetical protein
MEKPQLPATTVVTPWYDDGLSSGSQNTCASKWVWMSMKPGATAHPDASTSTVPSSFGPISSINPRVMATSAIRPGSPVPSKTVPPRITRSADISPAPLHRPVGS